MNLIYYVIGFESIKHKIDCNWYGWCSIIFVLYYAKSEIEQ